MKTSPSKTIWASAVALGVGTLCFVLPASAQTTTSPGSGTTDTTTTAPSTDTTTTTNASDDDGFDLGWLGLLGLLGLAGLTRKSPDRSVNRDTYIDRDPYANPTTPGTRSDLPK